MATKKERDAAWANLAKLYEGFEVILIAAPLQDLTEATFQSSCTTEQARLIMRLFNAGSEGRFLAPDHHNRH